MKSQFHPKMEADRTILKNSNNFSTVDGKGIILSSNINIILNVNKSFL